MKLSVLLSVLLSVFVAFFAATAANAAVSPPPVLKAFSFQFKAPKSKAFLITQKAPNQELAFKLAASECFKKLTGNKYPGEEKGLEIIDICANPKM